MAKIIKGNAYKASLSLQGWQLMHGSKYLFDKYNVTVCERCSAWIASDRGYGRLPSKGSPTICEFCA